LLLYVILIAVAVYFVVRALQDRGDLPGAGARPRPRRPRTPPKPVAPDDDEDFLRELDRRRREPEDPEGA